MTSPKDKWQESLEKEHKQSNEELCWESQELFRTQYPEGIQHPEANSQQATQSRTQEACPIKEMLAHKHLYNLFILYCCASFCSGSPTATAIFGRCELAAFQSLQPPPLWAHTMLFIHSAPLHTQTHVSKWQLDWLGNWLLSQAKVPTTNCLQAHTMEGTCPSTYFPFPVPASVLSKECAPSEKYPHGCSKWWPAALDSHNLYLTSPPTAYLNTENIQLCEIQQFVETVVTGKEV